jgi:hypothetical protein
MECMSEQPAPTPFKTLGSHLKYLREQSDESLAEVSGAVEIDQKLLEQIEAGFERPVEDILLLLISHFSMPDHEAIQLWELAGYSGELPDQIRPSDDMHHMGKSAVMLLALDMRTVYTDGIEVMGNQAGLSVSFTQTSGQDKSSPVARLGMSYEQAERVMIALQQALLRAKYLRGPKQLPPANGPAQAADIDTL